MAAQSMLERGPCRLAPSPLLRAGLETTPGPTWTRDSLITRPLPSLADLIMKTSQLPGIQLVY